MRQFLKRSLFLATFVAFSSPAFAQPNLLPGTDYWATGSSGQTYFTFLDGDVESLCGALPDSSWDHTVNLVGVPFNADEDYDTTVERLTPAIFGTSATATVDIQVSGLHLRSQKSQATPCGDLTWEVKLSGPQRVNKMTIVRSNTKGGVFFATLSLDVEMTATDSNGNVLGSLFHKFDLPDPAGSTGTPWSYGGPLGWMPGRSTTGDCVGALREKLAGTSTTSRHYYCISEAVASGNCNSPCLRE